MIQIIPCLPGVRAESYNAVLPQIERLTAAMKKMGAERNASVAQIAIAWAIAKGTLPLVGATKVHHVLDAACASDIQLRDEEIILLEQLAAETRVDTRGAWKNRWCKARPEQTVMNDTHERAVPGDSNLYHFYCFV